MQQEREQKINRLPCSLANETTKWPGLVKPQCFMSMRFLLTSWETVISPVPFVWDMLLPTVASREWPQLGMGLQHVHFRLTWKKVLRRSSGGMRNDHTHIACSPSTWESTAQNDSTKWSVNQRLRALFGLERLQGKIKALGGLIAPSEEQAASKAESWPACRVFEPQDACLFL